MIAAIQAGGKSQRMGSDKALLEIGGRRLVERVLAAAKPVVERLLIVTNRSTADQQVYERLAEEWGAEVHFDIRSDCGPLGGIEAALSACAPKESALVLACDLPFLSPEFLTILRLRHEDTGATITVPLGEDDRVQPLVAIYSRECLPVLKSQIELGRLRVDLVFDLVRTCRVKYDEYRYLPGSEHFFVNLNTRADLEAAEDMAL